MNPRREAKIEAAEVIVWAPLHVPPTVTVIVVVPVRVGPCASKTSAYTLFVAVSRATAVLIISPATGAALNLRNPASSPPEKNLNKYKI